MNKVKKISSCIVFLLFVCDVIFGQVGTEPSDSNYKNAITAITSGKFEEAYTYLTEQNRLTPNNGYVYVNWAYCELVLNKDVNKALELVNKSFALVPKDDSEILAQCYATRAQILTNIDNGISSAINDYSEALKIDSTYIFALYGRGLSYLKANELEKAYIDFVTLQSIDVTNINSYLGMANVLYLQEKWDETIDKLSKALEYSQSIDEYSAIYQNRAACYIAKNDFTRAINDYLAIFEKGNNDTSTLVSFISMYPESKDMVISKLMILSNKYPDSPDWLIYLGDIYRASSDIKKALKSYKEAEDKGLEVDLNGRISDCFYDIGDYIKAYKYIEKAANFDPNNYEIEIKRADILYQMGRPSDAISIMNKVVQLEPEFYYSYHQRGWYKDLYGDLEGAVEDYNIAIILNPNHAYSYFNRGRIRVKQGAIESARKDFETVLSIDTIAQASSVRQYAFLHLGNVDKAKEWMNQMLDSDRSMGNYYDAACLYSLMDEKDIAISYLRKALESGFRRFFQISIDNDLDNIRNTGAFKSLIKEYETIYQNELKEYEIFI